MVCSIMLLVFLVCLYVTRVLEVFRVFQTRSSPCWHKHASISGRRKGMQHLGELGGVGEREGVP